MNLLQTTNVETASTEEMHLVLLDAATCYASAFALAGINKSTQRKVNAKIAKKTKSEAGLKAANARLDQKGGYRETTAKIRNEWATGNYAGRDECGGDQQGSLGVGRNDAFLAQCVVAFVGLP